MRSAGCAINDYADRHFDGHVERTAARPLATGAIRPPEALAVFAVLSLVAFALVLTLNPKTVAHSFVALALAAIYPFTKRVTHMPQLMLGLAFGWAVPMAFTAIRGEIPLVAWWLFAATVIWALIYDTIYAMVDRDEDRAIGVKSTALLFGRFDTLIIGLLQILMLALLVWAGVMVDRGGWYFAGLLGAALLFAQQQWQIRDRARDACFRAFLNNHYVGMVVFVGILLDFVFDAG
jgi:4-hydroxybenzoate polyprenyltransferase